MRNIKKPFKTLGKSEVGYIKGGLRRLHCIHIIGKGNSKGYSLSLDTSGFNCPPPEPDEI